MTAGLLLLGCGLLALWLGWQGGSHLLSRRSRTLRDLGRLAPVGRGDTDLHEKLHQAALFRRWRPETFRAAQVGCALVTASLMALPGLSRGQIPLVAPLVGGASGWFAPSLVLRVLLERRRLAMDRAVGDLIGHLRMQTSIHIPLLQALESAPPVVREPLRAELEELVADCRLAPLPSALERFAARTGHARVQELVEHLQHQQSLGVPLFEVFTEEEQHQMMLMKEEIRQRIRSATITMSIVTFLLFLNGAIVFMTPVAFRALEFLSR